MARDMIADLLSINGCVMREEGPGNYSANFQDAVQAVKAARHLQRMIRGFCSGSEPGSLNGCVVLVNAEEPAPALDLALLQETQVLQPAQPGQILLVGALCESARLIPGLQFHPLSGGVAAPDRSGRPREVLHLLPPASSQEASEKPVQFRTTSTGSRRRITTAEIVAQSAAKGLTPEPPTMSHRKPDAAAATVYDTDDESAAKKKFPVLWVALGGVAAAAVVGAAMMLGSSHKAAAPAASPSDVPAASTATPAVVESVPAPASVPEANTPPPPPVVAAPPKPVPAAAPPAAADGSPPLTKKQLKAQQLAEAQAKKKGGADEADPEPKNTGGGGLINSADIQYLLAAADKESGDGKYEQAITKYRAVLKVQPTNAAAKEGLARAMRNRDSQ